MAGDRWYGSGLKFECTQCGNCCTGAPGYVWATAEERRRIAEFLGLEEADFTQRYARHVGGRYSLKEKGAKDGWDCVFLEREGDKRICRIYPARPMQCRTWPFWSENLKTASAWASAATNCPGMNHGAHHDYVQIEIRRNQRS